MEKVLSAKDICAIVKACAENGVSSLKIGELHIELGVQEKPSEQPIQYIYSPQPTETTGVESSSSKPEDENYYDSQFDYIEDPAEWERRQLEEK